MAKQQKFVRKRVQSRPSQGSKQLASHPRAQTATGLGEPTPPSFRPNQPTHPGRVPRIALEVFRPLDEHSPN